MKQAISKFFLVLAIASSGQSVQAVTGQATAAETPTALATTAPAIAGLAATAQATAKPAAQQPCVPIGTSTQVRRPRSACRPAVIVENRGSAPQVVT
ncbi:MAG: hypothetical protein M3447_07930, partial [Acidobacteriota bacterium]|nr:hypothetical protein [Acidobacteriota bacterium]